MHAGLLIPSIWLGGNQPVTATATQQACRAETQRMSQERPLKWCGRSAMLLFFFVFYLQLGRPPNRSMHRRENKEQALPKAGRQGAPMLHRCSCTTRGLCQPPGCHVLLPQQHSIRVSSQPRTRGVDLSARLHATTGAAAARCSGGESRGTRRTFQVAKAAGKPGIRRGVARQKWASSVVWWLVQKAVVVVEWDRPTRQGNEPLWVWPSRRLMQGHSSQVTANNRAVLEFGVTRG